MTARANKRARARPLPPAPEPSVHRRILVHVNSNDPGIVPDLADRLKEKYLPGRPRVRVDKDRRIVTIEDLEKATVEAALARYAKAFADGRGHGGYRLSFSVEEKLSSEREEVESEVRGEYERRILELRQEHSELERKWGAARRSFEDEVANLTGSLRLERKRLDEARTELSGRAQTLVQLRGELEVAQDRHRALDTAPVLKVVWSRVLRFLRR